MNVPSMPRGFWWILVPVGLVLVIAIAFSFLDEPLRAYAERELNQRLPAYRFQIGALDLHPLSLSIDVEDVTVRQKVTRIRRSPPSQRGMRVSSGARYSRAAL